MIMVILGAGASYDSVPSRPPSGYPRAALYSRPPLANELFLDGGLFADALGRFPECHPIVPYLQRVPAGTTLEHTLETLQAETETDAERHRQLAAIRFYLHFVVWECERQWNDVARGVTNYVTLLDQLRRCRRPGETVCLVTFNYDRMIEAALRSIGITIEVIPDYIGDEAFQLFKLHGSVHWAREVETPIADIRNRNVWDVGHELIRRAAEITISSRFRTVGEHPIGKADDVPLFPAIAIPVETKRGYECPEDHLDRLRGHLPKITKILAIGWRGTEQHFLGLLKDTLEQEVPVCVVAGRRDTAEEVLGRMRAAGLKVAAKAAHEGFSEFVISREAEEFFRS